MPSPRGIFIKSPLLFSEKSFEGDTGVKINPVTNTVQFLDVVKESRDGKNQSGHQKQEQQDKQQEENKNDDIGSFEEVQAAVKAFHSDMQTQANGLSAAVEGSGPGLRVVLKDGSSAVIRQFTGEEFLKLREAVGKDIKARGKILDQKL